MRLAKPTIESYQLFHQGAIALAKMEANGLRIDTEYLDGAIAKVGRRIAKLQARLKEDPIWTAWQKECRRRGKAPNLGSRTQLTWVLFEVLGHKHQGYTFKTERKAKKERHYKTDEASLEKLDLPFVRRLLKVEKLKKLKATYLEGIKEETVDGFLHPSFNLHTVTTFRGSSDSPNFQNLPIRDPEFGEIVRKAFIPRPGRRLVENDFSALEFKIAACCWQDPEMMSYASDPKKDVHRDQAADMFMCDPSQVSKGMRYQAKAGFVFPTLYGSYWRKCAAATWLTISGLKMVDGTPVADWLASKGITNRGECDTRQQHPSPGTYEAHMKGVEERFMARFPVFARGKEERYLKYRNTGFFTMPTGFVCYGLYSKNDTLNYWIQGPGFHCLLWTIIRVQKVIDRRQMKSLLVGQIHDCANADCPENEIQDYLNLVQKTVEVDLPKAWPWLTVPLGIEAECTDIDGSWWGKKVWEKRDGKWGPK